MATLYANEADKVLNTTPIDKADTNAAHGRVRILSDEITLAAELSAGDVIKFGGVKMPKGARLVGARLVSPQLGSGGGNGELDMGWEAGANGDEAADADGIFDGVEVGSAVADVDLQDSSAASGAYLKVFDEAVQIIITANETTDAGSGDTIQAHLYYVLD